MLAAGGPERHLLAARRAKAAGGVGRQRKEEMIAMEIFGAVLRGLAEALDFHQARHNVIAENLANVETPGYRARDLDFQQALDAAFVPGADLEVEPPAPVVDPTVTVKANGNSVDLDRETTRLSENAFQIVALSRLLAKKYAGLRETLQDLR
jgi:flagellar basal-body rod protein FlgB